MKDSIMWAVRINKKYWLTYEPLGTIKVNLDTTCLYDSEDEASDYADMSRDKYDTVEVVPVTVTLTPTK